MKIGRAASTFVICGLTAGIAHLAAQDAAPSTLHVTITSPDDDAYVSGPIQLRAVVDPAGSAVGVTFFVDGRQVCRTAKPPYECDWDAGDVIAKHQIRVVAAGGGARSVATIATKGAGFVESVDVELVHVTASVRGPKNRYVRGLPKTAFRVSEDGQPQTISHFLSEGVPLDLVLAIDVSSSMTAAMPKVKEAVKQFLAALGPQDRVTVLGFNDNIFTLTRKASDPADRARAVDRLAPWGATALYDVIIAGVDLLGREAGRKAFVVFTDGEDQGSHAPIIDAEHRLETSGVSLYMIGQGRGVQIDGLKKVMTRLSGATGGRALVNENLHQAFADILDELSNQYLIGYSPTNTRHDGTLRHLKVEVDGHYEVRAREVYRAQAGK
jgi:VWFA-related protein